MATPDLQAYKITIGDKDYPDKHNDMVDAVQAALGFDWQSGWVTATTYAVYQMVTQSGFVYLCVEAHTSGTFSTDLAAGKWELLFANDAFLEAKSGRKNLIINGDFSNWQRGTTFTGAGAVQYTADRWRLPAHTGNVIVKLIQAVFGGTLRFYKNTSSNTGQHFTTRLEVPEHFKGRTVNLSLQIKWATWSAEAFAIVRWVDGTQVFPVVMGTDTSGWQLTSASFTLPNDASNYAYLEIFFYGNNTTGTLDYDFQIADVQLELGSEATDFEVRLIAEELAFCKRYFERISMDANFSILAGGQCISTTEARIIVNYEEKRVDPTITMGGGTHNLTKADASSTTAAFGSVITATKKLGFIEMNSATGLVAGDATVLHGDGSAGNFIDIDAEF